MYVLLRKKKTIPQIMKPWPSKHCFHHLDISLILHSSFYWGVYNSKGLIREEKENLKIESGDIDLIQSLTKFYVVFADSQESTGPSKKS